MTSSVKSDLQTLLPTLRPGYDCVRAAISPDLAGVFAVDNSVGIRGCRGNTLVTLRELSTGVTTTVGWRVGGAAPVPLSVERLTLSEILALGGVTIAPAIVTEVLVTSEEPAAQAAVEEIVAQA